MIEFSFVASRSAVFGCKQTYQVGTNAMSWLFVLFQRKKLAGIAKKA
jgi:hypothetical protein